MTCIRLFISGILVCFAFYTASAQHPAMYFGDTTKIGRPYAKDPSVVFFNGQYFLYYSTPGENFNNWNIGIASSKDLTHWQKVGELNPEASYEKNGLCAPGSLVKDGMVHLFYQTYGNGKNDAICHATSTDGIHFKRDESNPIFHPSGDWTCGRAIDAEVVAYKDHYLLFFATRDTSYQVQKQGVAAAPLNSSFAKDDWTQLTNTSILQPELPWEKKCIEAASCIRRGKYLYMFYAGGYNNEPQQIGVARSKDGVHWKRLSDQPFLPNGPAGSWNESESGHPGIFKDVDGKTYLFYQGNNDRGKTWFLSKVEIGWTKKGPYLIGE